MSMFEAVLMGGGGGLWAFGGSAVRLRGRRTVVRWASWTGPNLLNQTTSHQPVESQESIHLLPPCMCSRRIGKFEVWHSHLDCTCW